MPPPPGLLYLNRQCVTLLSGLGVPDEVFIGLQDNMLRRLASMLLFETVAIETLRQNSIAGGLKVMGNAYTKLRSFSICPFWPAEKTSSGWFKRNVPGARVQLSKFLHLIN